MRLQGQTILITGAAGGLGSELANKCATQGAELVLLDRDRRGLETLSDRMTDAGLPSPGLYPLNLAGVGVEEFSELVGVLESEYGGLDVLIHCAVEFDGLRPLDQVEPQQWLLSMQVNVNAPWLLSSMCLPLLKSAERGRLVFLLDNPEVISGAFWGPYGVAKNALEGMVRQFSETLGNTRVDVLGIDPGPMRTSLRARVYHAENPLDQPGPDIAAARITQLLSTGDKTQDTLIRLYD